MRTVAIVAANGQLGSALVEAFALRPDWQVRPLTRAAGQVDITDAASATIATRTGTISGTTISSLTVAPSDLKVGMAVNGTGIPSGTVIQSINVGAGQNALTANIVPVSPHT